MTRTVFAAALSLMFVTGLSLTSQGVNADEPSPAQRAIDAAAQERQYTFILFYRVNNAVKQGMERVLQRSLSQRQDATVVPVQIGNAAEQALVQRFDASRTPLPAVVALAPNGAVTGVFPQRLTPQQIAMAIVSPGEAECVKALQEKKLVLMCVHPVNEITIPDGVRQFVADEEYKDRTQVVNLQADDAAEARFLQQLNLPNGLSSVGVVVMAPPGVMVGTFDGTVTQEALLQKLAAAGKCCDDPNCKHRRASKGHQRKRR